MSEQREKFLTMGLLAIAVVSQIFLFEVAYTNCSFTQQQYAMRDYLAPSQLVSAHFDQQLTIIADNLRWAVGTSGQVVGGQTLAFLGLDQPDLQTTYNNPTVASLNNTIQPQVLGAYQVNPAYSH